MTRNTVILASAAVLVGAFIISMLVLENRDTGSIEYTAKMNASSLVREHSPKAGNEDARVTIVEFFDPACGTCRLFHPIVKDILRDNPEDVVKILEAARLQGKFWETLEAAYATQGQWAINHQAHPELFWRSISHIGLDPEQVSRDMQSQAVSQNVQQDVEDGTTLGVNKTPGFFVNGKPLIEFGQMQLLQLVNEAIEREYGN